MNRTLSAASSRRQWLLPCNLLARTPSLRLQHTDGRAAAAAAAATGSPSIPSTDMTFTQGELGLQADGAVVGRQDRTALLAAVTAAEPQVASWASNLSVSYREKTSAMNLVPTNYFRRDTQGTTREVLLERAVDRALRPFYPECSHSLQINGTLLAADGKYEPLPLLINAASAALRVSPFPWPEPVAAVRIGVLAGEFVINPTNGQRQRADLDLIYAGSKRGCVMLEGSANNIPTDLFCEALVAAHEAIQPTLDQQLALSQRQPLLVQTEDERASRMAVDASATHLLRDALTALFRDHSHSKASRLTELNHHIDSAMNTLAVQFPMERTIDLEAAIDREVSAALKMTVLQDRLRPDGRQLDQVQNVTCKVPFFNGLHGSALFQRGETQSLATAVLDATMSGRPVDGAEAFITTGESKPQQRRFFLDYNFPSYATNDIRRNARMNRREIGHSNLAERSVLPVIGPNPFVVRVDAEVTSSNGSSSMATVSAACLALAHAGVSLKDHVAGLSCGMLAHVDPTTGDIVEHVLLTDALGLEDIYGDMDLKLAGTRTGVTGVQFDTKLRGVPLDILTDAVDRVTRGRQVLLDAIDDAISTVTQLHAPTSRPCSETLTLPRKQCGIIIGKAGVTINGLKKDFGASIEIDQTEDSDTSVVTVVADNREQLEGCMDKIESLLDDAARPRTQMRSPDLNSGETYTGRVVNRTQFGAFFQLEGHPRDFFVRVPQSRGGRTSGVVEGRMVSVRYVGTDARDRPQFVLADESSSRKD